MASEGKDYPRWTCNFCPTKDLCEGLRGLRGQLLCGTCPTALVCVMKDGAGVPDCDESKRRWRASLPSKCILAQSVLGKFAGVNNPFTARFVPTVTVSSVDILPCCPRCMMPVEPKIQHHWKLKIDPHRRQTVVTVRCDFCGLDEEMTLK